jgi:hypothetical protein
MRWWPAAMFALAALLVPAPELGAAPFSDARIIIEVNATDGDGGVQMFVDGEGWNRLQVTDPYGQPALDVGGSGSVGTTGVTELFFESAEPSFDDLPLFELLARFPEGNYAFDGVTVEGKRLTGRARLSHSIPDGPFLVSPFPDLQLSPMGPVIIDWNPVSSPYPGTTSPVTIVAYQVIVERVRSQPLQVFSVNVPGTITQVTVPPEFIQANAEYKFEVLAIEAGGNQTISESTFSTSR